MKIISILCGMLLLMGAFVTSPAADAAAKKGNIRHVVSLKFKESATPEQIAQVVEAFKSLKNKIPGIQKLAYGTNISPEKLNKGFTHCFILTFKNEKDRDAYLVHPDHKAFGQILKPVLDDVMVIDFLAKK